MALETIFLAIAWMWDEYGKDITDKAPDTAWQQWDKVKYDQAIEDSLLLPPGEGT